MLLSRVSYIDCLVFVLLLAPQLLIKVGFFATATWVLRAALDLAIKLPLQFLRDRFLLPPKRRPIFVRQSSIFQDIVIRCVRYAFAHMPFRLGRVFLSQEVSGSFLKWRMLRHGYWNTARLWRDVVIDPATQLRGVWIHDGSEEPDIIIYYIHGGGFSMGSSYFYLEFLLCYAYLLKRIGFRSPAILALEYTLVPEAHYPQQVEETLAGYKYLLNMQDASRIVFAGDSAGATLVLSTLLHLSTLKADMLPMPALASLISPWCKIISNLNKANINDYIDPSTLHEYGLQYLGSSPDPLESVCAERWRKASPQLGWYFYYGSEEVLAPEVAALIKLLEQTGCEVKWVEEDGGIHAWPVARMYLCDSIDERTKGLSSIMGDIQTRITSQKRE